MVLEYGAPGLKCDVLFSALPANIAREGGASLCCRRIRRLLNASAYRMEPDIPLLIRRSTRIIRR